MLHDFESNLRGLRDYQQRVILAPIRWRAFAPTPPLRWQSVRFAADTVDQVPEQRGIYAFVVQFQDHAAAEQVLPTHGYVMYVGITGHVAAERTLRDRYRDYLREERRGKRIQIWSMLTKWAGSLFFHYSVVDDAVDLGQLELDLNDAVIPPYVTKDFSAGIRELVRTLRSS